MSFINVTFNSHVLGMQCGANVILPQSSPDHILQKPFKTLYLLHGLSDDQNAWTRWTSIDRYANDYHIAVVMPNVHRSFYSDTKLGKYFTFVSDELISVMQEMFPLSDHREDRYAAGLSMGGYGAMKLGLACPDKFSVAASLSGALDIIGRLSLDDANHQGEFAFLFGNSYESREQIDLFQLAEKLDQSNQPKPRIYIWCGTEDFLYEDNVKFKNFLGKTGFDFTYEESPGDHSWGYWDEKIQTILKFIYNK